MKLTFKVNGIEYTVEGTVAECKAYQKEVENENKKGKGSPKSSNEPKPKETVKETVKEFKNSYEKFSKKTDIYDAVSKDSKYGNPNAKLTIKFKEKPSAINVKRLKLCGFKWDKENDIWYNANNSDAQEVFNFLK